jgi:hypothetical protein
MCMLFFLNPRIAVFHWIALLRKILRGNDYIQTIKKAD